MDRRRYGNTTYTYITGVIVFDRLISFSSSDPFKGIRVSKSNIFDFIVTMFKNDKIQVLKAGKDKKGKNIFFQNTEIIYTGEKY